MCCAIISSSLVGMTQTDTLLSGAAPRRLRERVLIMGGGPIGLAVAVFSKLAGARDVIVSEYARTHGRGWCR